MKLGLSDQVVIVSGGSRGIGRAIVEELLAEGANVATGSRHLEDLATIEAPTGRLLTEPLDVTDPVSIRTFVNQTLQYFGRIDCLVNNAGKAYPGTFESLTDQDWQSDIDVKLLAQVRMTRAVLPHLKSGGVVLNLTAIFGKQPDPRFFASSVNRAACTSLTRALAKELAPRGIRVNAVSIGFVESGQWHDRPPQFFEDMVRDFRVPLGRFGRAEEASHAAVFLLSEAASYLTGVILDVDGGMAAYL